MKKEIKFYIYLSKFNVNKGKLKNGWKKLNWPNPNLTKLKEDEDEEEENPRDLQNGKYLTR